MENSSQSYEASLYVIDKYYAYVSSFSYLQPDHNGYVYL